MGTVGLMLQYRQPWAALIVAATFVLQFFRLDYEEQILTDTFPRYRDYAERTSRLVPGIY
jgi:protein-S-isoprenylcysteine O-methyltransferase Ste14